MDYLCRECKHQTTDNQQVCTAFPDGKPLPIISGEITHDSPFPGDHGIQFEPREPDSR